MYDLISGHRITGQFGEDRKNHKHKGIDVAYPMDSNLVAMVGGKVGKIGNDPYGYGNYIDIISDGGLTERYAHANDFDVKVGDLIKEGQKIGRVGSTGRSTGPHIHVETLLNGRNINPMEVIKNPDKYLKKVIGTPQKQDIAPLVQAAAQNYTRKAMEQESEPSPLENRVNNILADSLKDVPVPQKITNLGDIFAAPKGERLGTALDYLQTPEGIRTINNILGLINPTLGGGTNSPTYNRASAQQAAIDKSEEDYQTAKQNQVNLAKDLLKEINTQGRFNKQLDFDKNKFGFEQQKFKTEQDYKAARDKIEDAFKKRELSQKDYDLQIKALDSKAERELKAGQLTKIKQEIAGGGLTKEQKEKQRDVLAVQQQVGDFIKTFDIMPSKSASLTTGLRQISGTQTPAEVNFNAQRTLLFNRIARDLGGEKGVLSDQDIKRVEASLPTLYDSKAQKLAKMKAVQNLIDIRLGNKSENIQSDTRPTLQAGTVQDGYKFKGGDPSKKENWEKL